jgi:hypothetical protein
LAGVAAPYLPISRRRPTLTIRWANTARNRQSVRVADNDQQGVLVLRASRRKWFAVLAVSLVFTSGGVAVVTDGRPLGWVPLVVFAVVALVATAAIVWRPQLRIDPDGMTLVQWWRQVRYDFRDCSEFMTWQNPFALGNTLVVFDHRTGDLQTLGYRAGSTRGSPA